MATHKQGNKKTSNNQRQKKNEMKAKQIIILYDNITITLIINIL